jgi:hypothetical protein
MGDGIFQAYSERSAKSKWAKNSTVSIDLIGAWLTSYERALASFVLYAAMLRFKTKSLQNGARRHRFVARRPSAAKNGAP